MSTNKMMTPQSSLLKYDSPVLISKNNDESINQKVFILWNNHFYWSLILAKSKSGTFRAHCTKRQYIVQSPNTKSRRNLTKNLATNCVWKRRTIMESKSISNTGHAPRCSASSKCKFKMSFPSLITLFSNLIVNYYSVRHARLAFAPFDVNCEFSTWSKFHNNF